MLITYSNKKFPALIKSGIKIHTIREDKHNRWKPGMKIHHWMFSPRNISKNPFPFRVPGSEILISKQKIHIVPKTKTVYIDNKKYNNINLLAYNDGLEDEELFFQWFHTEFHGYILHWTKMKYK